MAFDPSGELTGWDLTGFHEGQRHRVLEAPRRPRDDHHRHRTRTRPRHALLGVGAERAGRPADRRLQLLERRELIPAADSRRRRLGAVRGGVSTGNLYKFEILGSDGVWRTKAGPDGAFRRGCSHTASIVYESQYVWSDDQWMWYRGERKLHEEPISIYEVHIGSWRKGLTYLELASQLVEYCSWQGYTHVEFLPVAQHPFEGSWGYHVTGYFAPRFGSPDEFRHLVDALHQAGIGVLIDCARSLRHRPWALQRSTAPHSTSTRIHGSAGTPTGAPTSSTSAATR